MYGNLFTQKKIKTNSQRRGNLIIGDQSTAYNNEGMGRSTRRVVGDGSAQVPTTARETSRKRQLGRIPSEKLRIGLISSRKRRRRLGRIPSEKL